MRPLFRVAHAIRHRLGIDHAIAFTFTARLVQMLGSAGTVLLIMRFLSQVEQGYYYTLLSLVAIQIYFESGIAVVILQTAAHERAHLVLHSDGTVEGNVRAHARLASVLQKALSWYLCTGLVVGVILLIIGGYFFCTHSQAGRAVHWQGPWILAVCMCAVTFCESPIYAFLEGCGQVSQVAHARLWQSLVGIVLAWTAMILHHGLFSPAMVLAANALTGCVFFWSRRRLLLSLLRHSAASDAVAWRAEVWPFQWRIAISWMGSYVAAQVVVPILFASRGSVEAGQMGMSISIAGYLGALVLSWMHTKAAPFGMMVTRGEYQALDALYFRTLKQSMLLLTIASGAAMAGIFALQHTFPKLSVRMVSPPVFLLLLLTGFANFVVQSQAVYLRAHKREPFLQQSLVVAALTVTAILIVAGRWGLYGVSLSYLLCSGVAGLIFGTVIFNKYRGMHRVPELQVA